MDIMDDVKERLSIFKNIYDMIRIINPNNNKILSTDNNIINTDTHCYELWDRNGICENCISKKAYESNETVVKIEYNKNRIFLVMASPINIGKETYIVELVKDISKGGAIIDREREYAESIEKFLKNIQETTLIDDLTGVYNRRYIRERLEVDVEKSIREQKSMSVIMADIDYFKEINDTYGHIVGDNVLKDFTRIASKYIRSNGSDWIGRYGGEEFLIVLNDTDEDKAEIIAERIRKNLEETTLEYKGNKFSITCSFGVYGFRDLDMNTEDIIHRADINLYEAKEKGRNTTVVNKNRLRD
ncbi:MULTISPECIES: GGDEF domain-containing protein [unclassified Clostridium]|uniref:GGDEF domain-containing protein n=1 Tax=unclassified Clostridium TaxID=2614128 RepID=UPI003217DFCA